MNNTRRKLVIAVSAVALLFSLGVGSASAVPILRFFLTLNGRDVRDFGTPLGSNDYQLWVDPSFIFGGTFGFDWGIAATPSYQMTAFIPNPAALVQFNLNTTANTFQGTGGDGQQGNFTALEIGTLTINNLGPRNPGLPDEDITLFSGDYVDSNFALQPATTPQILAQIVPEPTTCLLVLTGVLGLTLRRRHARSASRGERASA